MQYYIIMYFIKISNGVKKLLLKLIRLYQITLSPSDKDSFITLLTILVKSDSVSLIILFIMYFY